MPAITQERAPQVFVQIPCLNEAATIGEVVESIPRSIEGLGDVTTVVVDDGSSDASVAVAREAGADHVITHHRHEGLGPTFFRGLQWSLEHGADIIVNTDGDGQYPSSAIPRLIAPLVEEKADLVVAQRLTPDGYYKPWEEQVRKMGSSLIRKLTGVDVDDPVSGFRAMSAAHAASLHRHTTFSYTLDTIVQARGFEVANVPVETRFVPRESRLRKNTTEYLHYTALDLYYAIKQVAYKNKIAERFNLRLT
ncbi:MAG TPA: glycosyltransferase family 2 protein [Candidatus Saccharimonadales bacterium]|nr:glycosyltransferase family 2 protein [Candidatus Saccharimonadales bacterium]